MQSTPTTPASEANRGLLKLVSDAQELLEQLVATQGRLVTTLLLLVLLGFSVVVLPAMLSWFRRGVVEQVESGRTGAWLQRLARVTPTSFRGILLRTAQLTVLLAIVVSFLIVWGVDVVGVLRPYLRDNDPTVVPTIQTAVLIMLAFVASDQLQRWIDRVSLALNDFTDHQEEILLRLGQVSIFVTVGASIFAVWNIDLSGLLVGAGFLGIVVGFAARQTLGSLIAGFVLMFSRPFTIGDWIAIDDQEGIVTDITIFNTRLENFDGEFIVIPNDRVSDSSLTNRSQKGLLRLTLDVGVDYDTDVERAMELARETMTSIDAVVASPPPRVVPKSFGDSAIVLELRFWIDHPTPPRKWRAISAVVQEVKIAYDEAGISIPFPQRTMAMRGDDSPEEMGDSVGVQHDD